MRSRGIGLVLAEPALATGRLLPVAPRGSEDRWSATDRQGLHVRSGGLSSRMVACRIAVLTLSLFGGVLTTPVAEATVSGLARTDTPTSRLVTGLSLAGDAVAWGEVSRSRVDARGTWTVRLVRPGGRARTRFSSQVPPFSGGALAASPDHLAVSPDATLHRAGGASRLFVGPLEGALQRIDPSLLSAKPIEWSGSLLATNEVYPQQGGFAGRLAIRDAATGFAPQSVGELPTGDIRIAGDYIALATPVNFIGLPLGQGDLRLDVVRLVDRQPVYSVTLPNTERVDFDLQADGKLAWLSPGGQRADGRPTLGTLEWSSPAEPWAHPLTKSVVSWSTLRVRLVDDHVVFARPAGGANRQYSVQPWITDLAGAAHPVWFALPPPVASDFDGTRLAVAAGGCIWMGDVREALAGPPAGLCPQYVTGEGKRKIRRGGSRYVYAFPCLMAPRSGCRGIARLEVSKRERGRRRVVARRKYRAGQGRVARVRFVVARRKLHTMRNRNGDLWLFVKVRSTDAAGVTHVSESFPFTAQP